MTSLSHEEQFDHASSIGRPTPGVEIRIVDDAGIAVKTGEPGELLVRVGQPGQYSVMRGYYNRPDETANTIKDRWIHTGDIAKARIYSWSVSVLRHHDPTRQGRSAINRVVEDGPRGGNVVQSMDPSVEAWWRRRLRSAASWCAGPEIA